MESLSPPPCPHQGVRDRDRARLRDNPGLPHQAKWGQMGQVPSPHRRAPSRSRSHCQGEGLTASGHQVPFPGSLSSCTILVSAQVFYLSPGRFWLCPCARMFFLTQPHGGFPTSSGSFPTASLSSLGMSSMPASLRGPHSKVFHTLHRSFYFSGHLSWVTLSVATPT